jgi:hypothetical protein
MGGPVKRVQVRVLLGNQILGVINLRLVGSKLPMEYGVSGSTAR